MLEQTSEKFRKFFILEFTKELIRAHAPEEIFKLKKLIENKQEEKSVSEEAKTETIKEFVKKRERNIIKKDIRPDSFREKSDELKRGLESLKRTKPVLRIPDLRLPPTFDYLKPTPKEEEIELGKLNPFIKDPLVKVIECNGPEEHVMVKGAMGTKPTKVVLNKKEIDEVIQKFSETARIPADEGVFKAVAGTLVMSAIISETIGSKFIIKKMSYHPGFAPKR